MSILKQAIIEMVAIALVSACGYPQLSDVPATQLVANSDLVPAGIVNTTLDAPFVVTAEDAFSNPISGVTVMFAVGAGDGSVSVDSAVTDEHGNAQTTLTLGTTAGTNIVEAQSAGASPAMFSATGLHGAPAQILSSGATDLAGPVGPFPTPLVVVVMDSYSNPCALVPGVTVSFAVTAGTGTVSPPTFNGPMGEARAQVDLGFGINTFEARVDGLPPLVFTASAIEQFSANVDFTTNPAGAGDSRVAVADFNSDGKPDLAVTNESSTGTVSVFLNTTATNATTPTFATKLDLATAPSFLAVAVGDFNGDGKPDLAVTNSPGVSIFLNTTATGATTPSFAANVDFTAQQVPDSIVIADFNGDGKPDIAVTNRFSRSVSVFLNTTATGATTPSLATRIDFDLGAGEGFFMAVGDLNADGKPDLAITLGNQYPNNVLILLDATATGATTPSFVPGLSLTAGNGFVGPGAPLLGAAIGDINGDGSPDLVVTGCANPCFASVFLNTTATGATSPSFAPEVEFGTAGSSRAIVVTDMNGDGKPELVIASDPSLQIMINTTPTGSVTPRFPGGLFVPMGQNPVSLVISDFNDDGKLDLATANGGRNSASVMLAK
jgi:hypothetical protein